MAEHVDTTEPIAGPVTDAGPGYRVPITVGLVVVAALAAVTGWLGYRDRQSHTAEEQRSLYVQVARQAAVNLTSISHDEADADIQRILDSATGTFRDDFEKRSGPFVEIVKRTQSASHGTVAEAGLESEADGEARVLVAVSVKTTTSISPQQDPRRWRMRISVEQVGEGVKVSNVEFVP
ncbi:tetratricopeptide repeat protein [Mycolicibacterium neworleansense]|uniref:Mce associated membrane protein n=1 Tax=Mycolicibacterium neworleansense TaxID=146018 RepID=A0A0H5RKM7_9MYCO|nr:tetratricopeptide repeat protein [Mycolicibacterium neworleansense]MCV7361748.1 Mce protein [Mycolicibacterium neworleansense]CRZ14052.1 Mce associated membrane protein [Mycolicibacterium neworleansense]